MHRMDTWTGLWSARYLGVETMVPSLLLMLWQPISEWYFWAWKYDVLAKIQCSCSGGKNKVLSVATLSNEIFCGSFLTKNLVICVPTTLAKRFFSYNPMNKKLVGGKNNVLVHYADASALDPEGVVRCNTFK
ncbi:hypothetical protein FRACYDRAFT_235654 [Fragilariopsis cylindrus CCMP1102]|uniref:Uncharacterized protein n=1 Tax=Fragilariopsis cylindrus CCMP1102 TaxID=635003 RepID=A0A1E7FNC4_9STRA|nr:hypothetical protein FRACYDRAFT_235654 [Fragilariopsis cylindrus CCMP1102]|eukprot:OEU19595.1 hypothetical protein FRACYDRAFT_235654 [Fragilariopsis cylindrus CCMP1102]